MVGVIQDRSVSILRENKNFFIVDDEKQKVYKIILKNKDYI